MTHPEPDPATPAAMHPRAGQALTVLYDTLAAANAGFETVDLGDWSAYPKVVGRDHVLLDLTDLALFLGGDATSFTGDLLRLIAKAQFTPENLNRLVYAFPRHVTAWIMWNTMSWAAPLTAGTLVDLLTFSNPERT